MSMMEYRYKEQNKRQYLDVIKKQLDRASAQQMQQMQLAQMKFMEGWNHIPIAARCDSCEGIVSFAPGTGMRCRRCHDTKRQAIPLTEFR
jgi:hypothetical protein